MPKDNTIDSCNGSNTYIDLSNYIEKKPVRIDAGNIRAIIDEIEYTWMGGFGCIMSSVEKDVKLHEVRMIGNQIFHAYLLSEPKWWSKKRKISWSIPDVTIEKIREIRKAIFGVR